MALFGHHRLTFLKICIILSIFGTCFVLLRMDENPLLKSDSRKSIYHYDVDHPFSNGKRNYILESYQIKKNGVELPSLVTGTNNDNETLLDLLFIFTRAHEVKFLEQKFSRCLSSLFKKTNSPLHLHIITDLGSLPLAKQILRFAAFRSASEKIVVDFYNVERIVEPLRETVNFLQPHFSYKPGAYYSDALFFLSVAIHRVFLRETMIMIDIDTKILGNILDLSYYFELFGKDSVMGLAHEQQPVYFHLLRDYRLKQPQAIAGGHRGGKGNPGFNSGVILLHLDRMRNSSLYNSYLHATAVDALAQQYQFKGHLGDQDFFTLLSFKHPELFYILPCVWNRQLCQWWKLHGYSDIFDKYYQCDGPIKLYHGNCNTPMPDENIG